MVDLAEGFYHVFRNGNQIVIDLSRNNKYEYYYITPDDYTLRSYEGERPMTGGSIGKITVMWGNSNHMGKSELSFCGTESGYKDL